MTELNLVLNNRNLQTRKRQCPSYRRLRIHCKRQLQPKQSQSRPCLRNRAKWYLCRRRRLSNQSQRQHRPQGRHHHLRQECRRQRKKPFSDGSPYCQRHSKPQPLRRQKLQHRRQFGSERRLGRHGYRQTRQACR